MKVLLVRPAASGGLAAHVDHELALLTAAGWDVAEAPVRIAERPHPREDLRTLRMLRSLLREADTRTTLHAHGLRAGALAALARGRRRAGPRSGPGPHRVVVTLHNRTVGSRATRLIGAALLRILARRADTVLAVSPDLLQAARQAGARDVRHAVIPAPGAAECGRAAGSTAPPKDPAPAPRPQVAPGAAPVAPGAAPAVPGAAPVAPGATDGSASGGPLEILVVARLAPQKGLHDLLDASALLREQIQQGLVAPVRIRIAGDGPLHAELDARIRAERLPVELLGRRSDVPALLAATDLVVSAARWEGQPVSLQEALQAGAPIVATDAGGTRWVTGAAAALVPVGDSSALAAAITAMHSPEARRAARAASRRRAAELPTAEDLLAQLGVVLAPGPRDW
ncbi:glycosyltransferase [Brachybacterium sp.]|uniref:glycosyltransferase n=1 Tax=Brachybacterium sp. TaxID=1891286 RepID=UPI002ED4ABDE